MARGKGMEFQCRSGRFQQVLGEGEVPWSGSDIVCSRFIPAMCSEIVKYAVYPQI